MGFKIGDQVRLINSSPGSPTRNGLVGIIKVKAGELWGVEFPGCVGFNDLNGHLTKKNGWFCLPERLEFRGTPVETERAPEPEAPTFWVFHDECWHACTNQACEGCGLCECASSTFHDHGIGECAGLHHEVWIEWFNKEIRCKGCYSEHD